MDLNRSFSLGRESEDVEKLGDYEVFLKLRC